MSGNHRRFLYYLYAFRACSLLASFFIKKKRALPQSKSPYYQFIKIFILKNYDQACSACIASSFTDDSAT